MDYWELGILIMMGISLAAPFVHRHQAPQSRGIDVFVHHRDNRSNAMNLNGAPPLKHTTTIRGKIRQRLKFRTPLPSGAVRRPTVTS